MLLEEEGGAPAAYVGGEGSDPVGDVLFRVAEVLAAVVEVEVNVAAFLAGQQAGLVVVPLILGELDVFHGAVGQVAGYV